MQLALGASTQVLDLRNYDLRTAILYTLAYSDVFDYPLTAAEVHRYLIGYRAAEGEVEAVLQNGSLSQIVVKSDKWYALAGREGIFAIRQNRAEVACDLWGYSLRFGRLVAQLPFVRMVAATGALVSDNVDKGADLDYLIVTKPGYLWVTRAMILALDKFAHRSGLGASLCPNYLVAETNLALDERDLFTAQELTRMVPIAGLDQYQTMRARNGWTDDFLPNAKGFPRDYTNGSKANGRFKSMGEFVLGTPPTRLVEGWEMRRKIAKFNRLQSTNGETRFSADFCKGHFDGHKQATMKAFEARLERLGLNGQ